LAYAAAFVAVYDLATLALGRDVVPPFQTSL
jgi:hypothetical protein